MTNKKENSVIFWLMLGVCLLELGFAILTIFVGGTTRTIFICLLCASSAAMIVLSVAAAISNKKHFDSVESKLKTEEKQN